MATIEEVFERNRKRREKDKARREKKERDFQAAFNKVLEPPPAPAPLTREEIQIVKEHLARKHKAMMDMCENATAGNADEYELSQLQTELFHAKHALQRSG